MNKSLLDSELKGLENFMGTTDEDDVDKIAGRGDER